MTHSQHVAMRITPSTLDKIFESRPEVVDLPINRSVPNVFVIFNCDMPGEKTMILPEWEFQLMFTEDPASCTDWTLLTIR